MIEYYFKYLTNQVIFVTLGVRKPDLESKVVYTWYMHLCGEIQETDDIL
jgi:hypothetical protein